MRAMPAIAVLTAAFLSFWATVDSAHAKGCIRSSENLPSAGTVVDYVTDITADDLTNSRGAALTDFRQILRQDRYNAHVLGDTSGMVHDNGVYDPFELDTYFTTPERRALFANADYSMICADDLRQLVAQIEAGRLLGFLFVRAYRGADGGLRIYMALVG